MRARERETLSKLAARLARVRLVDPVRDLIERLDRLEVVAKNLRWAATSAPTEDAVHALAARLERATSPLLATGVRVVPDDRARILEAAGAPGFLVRAIAARPQPLFLAFSWRMGERAPPETFERLKVGPILGYPACCVRFEERRRADLVCAEGRGMLETWRSKTEEQVLRAIDARRPYLADDVGEVEREERLRRFPFTSFVPCPRCCERGAASPAGKDDARRRALAEEISPRLARAIERARGA